MAQTTVQPAAAGQTIEAYVAGQLDQAQLGPIHWRVLALVTAGLFIDVMDFSILGALVPDLLKSGFITQPQVATIGSATAAGLLIGALGQGEFTDRFGRKAVYQFNLLLFGLATIAAALAPSFLWLLVGRFIAGIGLGAEGPLCYAYVAEYSPKRIRGRMLAFMQFIGGAWPWPIGTLFALGFRDVIGWRGIWIVIGIAALIVFVLRFALPGSPRWLATHGRGQDALDLLQRMDLPTVPLASLRSDAASDTHSDPFAVVFRSYPGRIAAAMVCFFTFFGIALGLGAWLPNILIARGLTITKSLSYTFGITLAFPCSSALMMYALEKFGRKPTAVAAFLLAGVFAIGFASATSNTMVLVVGFVMIFFIQLAGNSSQTFISEVFPTNARASGFGLAQSAGRVGAMVTIPSILFIQQAYGLTTVFAVLAVFLAIAAFAVTRVGPEARGLALDELAPPTG
jgi:MFS transporter, putative metabolite:H+ symporter